MVKIESLKEYFGKISQEDFFKLSLKIYEITSFLSKDYPKYKKWFFTKQLPGVMEGERNILFVRNPNNCDEIISVAYLKKNNAETKLCNLYVKEGYRNLGIGTQMLEESIKWLGTTKPLVTFSEYKMPMFSKFIIKYNWQLTEVAEGLYKHNNKELCFNGTITKKNQKNKTLSKKING